MTVWYKSHLASGGDADPLMDQTEICRSSAQLTGVGLPIQIGKSMSQLCRATAVTPSRGLLELLDLATLNGRADLVQALGDLLEINMLMQLESVKGAH